MKIVHVGNGNIDAPNGVHQATGRLAALMQAQGAEVEIWHFSRSVREITEHNSSGVTVVDFPVTAPSTSVGSHVQFATLATMKSIRARARHVDVLHLHSVFQPDHLWTAHLGVPFVITPHGGYHPRVIAGGRSHLKKLWLATHDRRMLRAASVVHVLANQEAENIVGLCPQANIQILAVPVREATSAVSGVARSSKAPVVFIGRYDIDHKGLDLLIRAWARLGDERGSRELVLAGPGTPRDVGQLEYLAQTEGVAESVRQIAAVYGKDKEQLLDSASWFVHASRREGLPLGMVEAMQRAVPLIATEETNLADVIRQSSCGFVDDATCEGVARALRAALLTSESNRQLMAQRAQSAAMQFSEEALRDSWVSLYERARS